MTDENTAKRPGRSLLRVVWRIVALTFGVVVVTVALAIGLFRVLVPLVPDYHEKIEAAASAALGYTVRVARIDARWRLRGPEVVFIDATVYEEDGGAVLARARDGYVNLDVGALITQRRVVPDRISLRGIDLDVTRDADGQIAVAGRSVSTSPRQPSTATRWPLPDGRFELREASLRFIDEGRPPLLVPEVNVNLDVNGTRLRIVGDVTPPEGMGDSVEVSVELDGKPNAPDRVRWQVYLAGGDLDLSALARLLDANAPAATAGRGDVVFWAGLVGSEARQASLEIDVAALELRRDPLPYERLRGRFEWDRTSAGWEAQAHDLYLERGDGVWPVVEATLSATNGPGGARELRLSSPFLRIEDLAPFVTALASPSVRAAVAARAPAGDLRDVDVAVSLPLTGVSDFSGALAFRNLGWQAVEAAPGARGLGGQISLDALGGRMEIDTEAVTFDAPRVLGAPLKAWRVAGGVVWRRIDEGWHLVSDKVLVATEDFDALARVSADFAAGTAPVVDLGIELGSVDITSARRYLPQPLLKPKLADWLERALQGGTVTTANVRVRGALDRFPFDDGDGEFSAQLVIDDLLLDYAKDWPLASSVDAIVDFAGRGIEAQVLSGKLGDAGLTSGAVAIANLKEPVLTIDAMVADRLTLMRDYFLASPASKKYTDVLSAMQPEGESRARFTMNMPLRRWREFTYGLDLDFSGANVGYGSLPLRLENLEGTVRIATDGITSDKLNAVLLSRPVSIEVRSEPARVATATGEIVDTRTVVAEAQGRVDASMLGERLHAPLADYLSGATDWRARLDFPPLGSASNEPLRIRFDSDLQDMAVLLPPPLAQPANAQRPLTASVQVFGGDRCEVDVMLGADVHGLLDFERATTDWGLRRGAIVLGGGRARIDEQPGLAVTGQTPEFELGDWLALGRDGNGPPLQSVLRTANVSVGRLGALGQSIDDARVKLDRNLREWLIEIDSEQASGAVFYPFDLTGGEPVIVNMQRLAWRSGDGDGAPLDPRTLPAMRMDVQDFAWNEWRFGALSAQLQPVEDGLGITDMTTRDATFSTSASGVWRYAGGRPSEFAATVQSTDTAETLRRLNTVGAIQSGDATVDMQLGWDGPLDSNLLRELTGTINIRIGDGILANVDPKAGRVFGLLSITALPRRLSLDFRDVFQKGFAFDSIGGDFTLRDGSAYTENLTLTGPAAQVAIVGRSGLVDRDYDQQAVIYANFGSSLPLAGAIAGGPAVGAALLIFSEVFKDPLRQMGRVDYRITGSWDEPQIERLVASNEDQAPTLPDAEAPPPTPAPIAPPAPTTTDGDPVSGGTMSERATESVPGG